jgi:hypothetical protein
MISHSRFVNCLIVFYSSIYYCTAVLSHCSSPLFFHFDLVESFTVDYKQKYLTNSGQVFLRERHEEAEGYV